MAPMARVPRREETTDVLMGAGRDDVELFAQRAGIDLRSLPYSFLILERRGLREPVPGLSPAGWSRVLGEPRVYKGFAKVLSCQTNGVRELELQKRDAPEIFKAMKHGNSPVLLRAEDDGRRFVTPAESVEFSG